MGQEAYVDGQINFVNKKSFAETGIRVVYLFGDTICQYVFPRQSLRAPLAITFFSRLDDRSRKNGAKRQQIGS